MTESLVKKRKFAVLGIEDQKSISTIKEHFNKKQGIIAIEADAQEGMVRVEYDLEKINFERIEKSIQELGFCPSKKLSERFKRGMAKFTEQNELDNLKATPSSCCENPKEKNQHVTR